MTVQGEVCDSLGACSTEEAATLVTATQIAASEVRIEELPRMPCIGRPEGKICGSDGVSPSCRL